MTIRIKAFLIIAAIMSGITLTTMATSLPVIRGSLEETMQGDISVMADLGDKLVSSEIALMKADAELVAQKLLQAPREDWAR
ncbi:MAG: hypothetical protein LBO77_01105, partial [Desulfovibrio sp.]|nr:hypothetical protein [Desulfovibrio sp.]